MRSRHTPNEQVAAVARRRLELVGVELSRIRQPSPQDPGSTQPAPDDVAPVPGVQPDPQRGGQPRGPGRHAARPVGVAARTGGWLHDRLPPTLQGTVRLTSGHLTVVAVLVAAAMAVTAWWVLRADGAGVAVPAVQAPTAESAAAPLVELSALPGAAPPEAPVTPTVGQGPALVGQAPAVVGQSPAVLGQSPGASVIVDVAGKVRRPGIATLPAGSRVADALKSAGGARRGVDLSAINLARVLVDGEQVLVGVPLPSGVAAPAAPAPVAPAPSGAPVALVNINTADQVALETLPGVGPVTAQAIMTWRTDNGAFTSVDELLEVSGIGDVTLAEMAPFVTI